MSDPAALKAPKRIYTIAGIYGLIVLLPLYFGEHAMAALGQVLTKPEYYYGFLGAACSFQLVYLMIGRDPLRFRPLMPLTLIAKLSFTIPVAILFLSGRVDLFVMIMASIDALIGLAFLWAWRVTPLA
ncbi:MAG: hypothetical protein JWL96_2998 [Sphingomonas bacterium]|uniref:hypothetical protein n=1 Tax=Sphingomonas bacterium TaxID=1895847 RepID=UPI00261A4D81|nr:hypothetical protein [Sphingomonas bacterium]MDB5710928.1 hypothetical protein [Sphingomonas bacterium]